MCMAATTDFAAIRAEIKARIDLRDLIAGDLGVRRRGDRVVARCPFHQEKTPSFTVYQDHFFCFGCEAKGDIFAWLQSDHHCFDAKGAYHEALRLAGMTPHAHGVQPTRRAKPTAAAVEPITPASLEPWMQPFVDAGWQALSAPRTAAAKRAAAYLEARGLLAAVPDCCFGVAEYDAIQQAVADGAPARVKAWYGRIILPFFWSGKLAWFKVRYVGSETAAELKAKNILRYDGPNIGHHVLPAPFNADSLQFGGEALLVEGELNAASIALALPETAIIGLPGGRLPTAWAEHLKTRTCAAIVDDDPAGEKHFAGLREMLEALNIPLRRISLRRASDGEKVDANDISVKFDPLELAKRIKGEL
jgi:CHC2 zinc finger